MIVGCFRGCFSFKADTKFEKARLQATYNGDCEPPAESDIQNILKTLSGHDPETRPDVAFSLIQSKLQYSESKNAWNYIVKNLIILDRCIEDRSFVNDIASIQIQHVETYKDPDPKNRIIKIDGFIRKYYQYIKMKSRLIAQKNSSFNVSKTEKRQFFRSLTIEKLFDEMTEIVALFTFTMDLVRLNTDPLNKISKRGYLEYKVNQYVYHLILHTLMNLYIAMFSIVAISLERLQQCNLEQSQTIKFNYMQFLKNGEIFSQFVSDNRFIKGYEEIKVSEFYQPNRNAVKLMNDWISFLEGQKNQVDKSAITIKLGDDVFGQQIVIQKINRYPIITNNKCNFLGEKSGNYVDIKLIKSELRDNASNSNYYEDNVKLDYQDSYYNREFLPYRYLEEEEQEEGQCDHEEFERQKECPHNLLESTKEGFNLEFFSLFKNEYSSFSHPKNGKFAVRMQREGSYLERQNILEHYFQKSFQSSVSFMINDKVTGFDTSLKEIALFNVEIFYAFQNDYSVQKTTHYFGPSEVGIVHQIQEKQEENYPKHNNNDNKSRQHAITAQKQYYLNPLTYQHHNNTYQAQNNYQFVNSLVISENINSFPETSSNLSQVNIQFIDNQQKQYLKIITNESESEDITSDSIGNGFIKTVSVIESPIDSLIEQQQHQSVNSNKYEEKQEGQRCLNRTKGGLILYDISNENQIN